MIAGTLHVMIVVSYCDGEQFDLCFYYYVLIGVAKVINIYLLKQKYA